MLILDDDFRDGGTGPRRHLGLALAPPCAVGLTGFPRLHRFCIDMLKTKGLPALLSLRCGGELTEDARFDTCEEFRHRRLTNPEIRGDAVLRPSTDGQFHRAQLANPNARRWFMATLATTATTAASPARALRHRTFLVVPCGGAGSRTAVSPVKCSQRVTAAWTYFGSISSA